MENSSPPMCSTKECIEPRTPAYKDENTMEIRQGLFSLVSPGLAHLRTTLVCVCVCVCVCVRITCQMWKRPIRSSCSAGGPTRGYACVSFPRAGISCLQQGMDRFAFLIEFATVRSLGREQSPLPGLANPRTYQAGAGDKFKGDAVP